MTGLFLPDGSHNEVPPEGAPRVEWRRLAVAQPYSIGVETDPVRVVLTQRYVDENGVVREQNQELLDACELVAAIAMNDYMAAVRGRIASDLSDVAMALGLSETELDDAVEAMSQQLHERADATNPRRGVPERGAE